MNDYEIERIAAAINTLRPDWPTKSLITLMHRPELTNRPRRDVAVALAWIACETNTANPGRVIEAGPWWKAATIETPNSNRARPPKKTDECPHHPGQWATSCGGCRADQLAGDEHPPTRRDTSTVDHQAHAQACRTAIGRVAPPPLPDPLPMPSNPGTRDDPRPPTIGGRS